MRAFDLADIVEADEERDDADDAEAAVDETPVWRNAANGSGNEGEGDDSSAGDDAELEYPPVAERVDERTDERNGNDEVGEGQPVRAIGHEGVSLVGLHDAIVNAAEPGMKGGLAGGWGHWGDVEDSVQGGGFGLERKGSDAAEGQSGYEQDEPEADSADEAS
jgi:hypothetical protein